MRFAQDLTPTGKVHLQGIGKVPGKPAAELQPGDTLMWNYGSTSTVISVTPKAAKSVVLVHACNDGAACQIGPCWHPRLLRATRLMPLDPRTVKR